MRIVKRYGGSRMNTILPKSQMTEEDIKLNYITPALVSRGWQNKITMETKVQFTDGKVNIRGNIIARDTPKKAESSFSVSVFGTVSPVSQRDTACRVTNTFSASSSCDIPFFVLNS